MTEIPSQPDFPEMAPALAGLAPQIQALRNGLEDELKIALNLPGLSRLSQLLTETYPSQAENFRSLLRRITEILISSRLSQSLGHAEYTVRELLEMNEGLAKRPELLFAGYVHDIDRCKKIWRNKRKDFPNEKAHKEAHAKNAGDIVMALCDRCDIPQEISLRVQHLVEHHEFGVDEDTNALMLADAIAFFKHNLPYYYGQELRGIRGKKEGRTREKIRTTIAKFNDPEYAKEKAYLFNKISKLTYNKSSFLDHQLSEEEWADLDEIFQEELKR